MATLNDVKVGNAKIDNLELGNLYLINGLMENINILDIYDTD